MEWKQPPLKQGGQTERSFFLGDLSAFQNSDTTSPLTPPHYYSNSTTMAPKTPAAVSDAIKKLSASEQG